MIKKLYVCVVFSSIVNDLLKLDYYSLHSPWFLDWRQICLEKSAGQLSQSILAVKDGSNVTDCTLLPQFHSVTFFNGIFHTPSLLIVLSLLSSFFFIIAFFPLWPRTGRPRYSQRRCFVFNDKFLECQMMKKT